MSIWTKIWRWGGVAILTIGALLTALFLFKRRGAALQRVVHEIGSIREEERTAKLEALRGREEALRDIEIRYHDTIKAIEAEDKARIEELRKNPSKLARELARKGKKL